MGPAVLLSTKIKTIFLFAVLFGFVLRAEAEVELGLDFTARSYPLSGTLTSALGVSWTFWGSAGQGPWYGYLKPELQWSTAGAYNSGLVQVKVFPLSFLGVVVGGEAVSNTQNFKAYDCVTYRCVGKNWQTFAEGQFALAMGPVFTFLKAGLSDWHQAPDQDRDFINPTWGLATRQQGDRLRTLKAALGAELSDHFRLIYAFSFAEMIEKDQQSHMHLALLQWQMENWRAVLGGGVFRSEIKRSEGSAILSLSWHSPTVELF